MTKDKDAISLKRACKDHPDGLKASCVVNNCKTPGSCHGKCGCLACDGHYVDSQYKKGAYSHIK